MRHAPALCSIRRALRSGTIALGFLATACGGDEGPTYVTNVGEPNEPPTPPAGTTVNVRVVHASPDAPEVDVYAAGVAEPLVRGLAYGDASAYLEVPAGSYDIELRAAPSTAADPVAYATGPIALAGGRVTAIAAGLLSSSESASRFRVLALAEGFGPAGTGSAVARIVHASPDAPTVGVDLHDDDAGAPEVSALDRFGATDAAGVVLTAGEKLQLGVTTAGARLTAFTTPALPEGAELFVIATGLAGRLARERDGFALLAVGPDGSLGFIRQNPIAYALHASPNAPAVDFYAAERLLGTLSFAELGGPLQVPPGDYALDFRAQGSAPTSPPAATASTGALEAGERYLTIATGLLGAQQNGFQLLSLAEAFALEAEPGARVRVVHASPDAPAVDVGILNVEKTVAPVLAGNVSFKASTAGEGIAAGSGTLPLGVAPAGKPASVVAAFHVPFAGEERAFAIAAGALAPQNGASFRLLVVDTAPAPWTVAAVHPQP
jgi:hypothetical protein